MSENYRARKLILHFGLAKTGTSALQHELFTKREILLHERGILYLGIQENHNYLQAMFSENPETLVQIQMLNLPDQAALDRFLEECRQKILDEVSEAVPQVIIVSSEYFSAMTMSELKSMRSFLDSLADEIQLIAFVRDPWSFPHSLIQEMARSGLLASELSVGYCRSNVEIIEKFEEAFNVCAVILPYCVGPHSKTDTVESFAECIGLSGHDIFRQAPLLRDVNKAMSKEAVVISLHLNRLFPTFDKNGGYISDPVRDWMIEALQEVQDGTSRLSISRKTADRIFMEAKPDIDLMEAKYFGGRPVFTNLYALLTFEEFDDALTLSCFSSLHLVEFMLSVMSKLSARAIHFRQQMVLNSNDRVFWNGKYLAQIGDMESARKCFEEVLLANPSHAGALSGIAALNIHNDLPTSLIVVETAVSRIIVVGASGYIGRPLLEKAAKVTSAIGTSSNGAGLLCTLDLKAPLYFDYNAIDPCDVIFLTAAISAPDICDSAYEHAWAVNVTGTSEFITKVMARGGRVVFFSSDVVYGERDKIFNEIAGKNPIGEYAEMKSEVEKRFIGNPLFKSIRLSYVFSREDKFTKYLSGCAERGEEAELFHPFYRAIIHRDDVVEGALALAGRWDEFPQQVINFGGPEVLSKIDFADCLKSVALPNLRYRVTEPGDDFFQNRPRVIAMSSNVLPELLGRPTRRLLEAVQIEFAST